MIHRPYGTIHRNGVKCCRSLGESRVASPGTGYLFSKGKQGIIGFGAAQALCVVGLDFSIIIRQHARHC